MALKLEITEFDQAPMFKEKVEKGELPPLKKDYQSQGKV